ncbi:phosphoribosylanthranilate isomerase [Paenibacillus albiflavus]|uniref:N-(5'-phosphoribosyl)anthranilate isomerase n=1 Tax=Paenibacillus albiflavus TaxID=2545760 RepID=A0A4R4ELQ3_9BACL|nr:phosphoribosylanthranilate isomerase [Paenibacillus albiflavus]TCZ81206.1 phosphoribosylanthranilate isomerase [Paenibacillus albiflavus]
MTSIKICGLQSVEVLKSAIDLNVEYVGLVFAKSKRQVTQVEAAHLVAYVRTLRNEGKYTPQITGVFLNPTVEQLAEVMATSPVDFIQLHGNETPEFCQHVKLQYHTPVMKAFSIRNEEINGFSDPNILTKELKTKLDTYRGVIDILLLDTYEPMNGGGSGEVFRWDVIPAYLHWARENNIQLFIAGGLDSNNVLKLLDGYAIDGVDISSGVETDGMKDVSKMKSFVERVRQHE